jgi:hypothetical protein
LTPHVDGHNQALAAGRFAASQLMTWARQLNRICGIDLEPCPNCGGELQINSAKQRSLHVRMCALLPARKASRPKLKRGWQRCAEHDST